MYKTELHAHTSETSNCGEVSAAGLVEAYIKNGYSTVVITDHLSTHTYFKYDYDNMSWDEKIDVFVRGYKAAVEILKEEMERERIQKQELKDSLNDMMLELGIRAFFG